MFFSPLRNSACLPPQENTGSWVSCFTDCIKIKWYYSMSYSSFFGNELIQREENGDNVVHWFSYFAWGKNLFNYLQFN
jgi:hypothetical protein